MPGTGSHFMKRPLCDESIRKNFRVMANALLVMLILGIVGTVISILIIVNMVTNNYMFPFSAGIDPPYLGIICAVVLALVIVCLYQINHLKHKTCDSVDGPFL